MCNEASSQCPSCVLLSRFTFLECDFLLVLLLCERNVPPFKWSQQFRVETAYDIVVILNIIWDFALCARLSGQRSRGENDIPARSGPLHNILYTQQRPSKVMITSSNQSSSSERIEKQKRHRHTANTEPSTKQHGKLHVIFVVIALYIIISIIPFFFAAVFVIRLSAMKITISRNRITVALGLAAICGHSAALTNAVRLFRRLNSKCAANDGGGRARASFVRETRANPFGGFPIVSEQTRICAVRGCPWAQWKMPFRMAMAMLVIFVFIVLIKMAWSFLWNW